MKRMLDPIQRSDAIIHEDYNTQNAFIAKVLGIVFAQLCFMITIILTVITQDEIKTFAIERSDLWIGSICGMFVFLFMCVCFDKVFPLNVISLIGINISSSWMIAGACARDAASSRLVIVAFVLTLLLFGGLIVYVLVNRRRSFFQLEGFLVTSLMTIVVGGVLDVLFQFASFLHMMLVFFGLLVFAGFVVFDMSDILHNHSKDDYITASLSLYLDALNIFVRIIECLKYFSEDPPDSGCECIIL